MTVVRGIGASDDFGIELAVASLMSRHFTALCRKLDPILGVPLR
jgi:hypothetical protein